MIIRAISTCSYCFIGVMVFGQITIDKPLRLQGEDGQRRIDGLGPPISSSSASTINIALLGKNIWAEVTAIEADTIRLAMDPPVDTIESGLQVRFLSEPMPHGNIFFTIDGSVPIPATRSDGGPIGFGQLGSGLVCELTFWDGHFLLTRPEYRDHPAGTIAINEVISIDVQDVPGLNYYEAQTHCSERSGRLCSWDEYVAACSMVGSELLGMFNGWEWINDTSDHTHTADQAGSSSCTTQRSTGPLTIGSARCCYMRH